MDMDKACSVKICAHYVQLTVKNVSLMVNALNATKGIILTHEIYVTNVRLEL
jgi:hypothetical protein